MQDVLGESLRKWKKLRIRKARVVAVLLVLSLLVSMDVFWILRQPGVTLAGDADCGLVEHTHDEGCTGEGKTCPLAEHTHSIDCYRDQAADAETPLDWQDMFAHYPYTGDLRQDLAGIARTQVGYTESADNFEVGSDGIRRGYTRYGAWYGAPYRDWSAMFVSFCLHYAGADPDETPGNTGGAAMAQLWQQRGKYAQVGEYIPTVGDLVFFTDNTVGIIAVANTASFYVIRGDVKNAVRGDVVMLTDTTVAGWGVTQGTVQESHRLPGRIDPELILVVGGSSQPPPMQRFSFRAPRAADLLAYLNANGGDYFFTLLDVNNQELPKDDAGNYVVDPTKAYKLTISFVSPEGFHPGTYQYQTPYGLLVDGGAGEFLLTDGTHVGEWTVTDEGLIMLAFNEHMNSRTDITISATLGIHFPEQNESIDFDGKITVTIQKPIEEQDPTKLNKWGSPGKEGHESRPDPTKIYWTIEIQGRKDSQIPGSVIADRIKAGEHRYTQSDIDAGLHFGAGEYDPVTGAQLAWHAWDVSAGDPNLVWTETGWTYHMPETIQCEWCPEPVPLGNNGWIYYIEYTSTPDPVGAVGTLWYTNEVTVDNQYMEGWGSFQHAPAKATIVKNGAFYGDAENGLFLWEFRATIPGRKAGEKAIYLWQIMDNLRIKNHNHDTIGYIQNDADRAVVTATHDNETFSVPNVVDATAADRFAWYNMWSADHGDGIYYGRALVLLSRCQCTEESCQFWDGHSCGSQYWYEAEDGYWYTNGMCHCWTTEEDAAFAFSYATDDVSVVDAYGGQSNTLQNEVLLQHTEYLPNGTANTVTPSMSVADVPIPGVFKKELIHDFDGYTAHYKVTINEGKLVLTDGSPLTIHDEMTQTLAFIGGSLVITAEDADGRITTLTQDVDYTVTYDGTGGVTDIHGTSLHVLDIQILHPQPVTYILDYDATLIIPPGANQAIKYNNSASITLWGEEVKDTTVEKVYADINIAAKSYKVSMFKTSSLTGEPLGGATFGLFNDRGGLITTAVTDENGELQFQTNVVEGIILREHILYYMQELRAPPGYQRDNTKLWFCFCDTADAACATCAQVMAGTDAFRIPFEQIGKVHLPNQPMDYDLPATGGPGVYPLTLASVWLILTPLVYKFIRRRKRERRGTG